MEASTAVLALTGARRRARRPIEPQPPHDKRDRDRKAEADKVDLTDDKDGPVLAVNARRVGKDLRAELRQHRDEQRHPPARWQDSRGRDRSLPRVGKDVMERDGATPDSRVWVSFKEGVYDVTEFIAEHPGGEKLLIGAGGPIEPFWALYAVHKKPYVSKIECSLF